MEDVTNNETGPLASVTTLDDVRPEPNPYDEVPDGVRVIQSVLQTSPDEQGQHLPDFVTAISQMRDAGFRTVAIVPLPPKIVAPSVMVPNAQPTLIIQNVIVGERSDGA